MAPRLSHAVSVGLLVSAAALHAPFAVRQSSSWSEDWQSAELLHRSFGGNTLGYLASLKNPALNANVFFKPTADPLLAVAIDESDAVIGVAQAMRVTLQPPVGECAGDSVAFVQSVAVAEGQRRRGVASALMDFCEASALEGWGDDVADMWLALDHQNSAARPLYEQRGYATVNSAPSFGNLLMMKSLRPTSAAVGGGGRAAAPQMCEGGDLREVGPAPSEPAATAATQSTPVPSTGLALAPLATNLGVQAMYVGIASLGISLLLSPFGGPSVASALGAAPEWPAPQATPSLLAALGVLRPPLEAALGLGVARLELGRLGVQLGAPSGTEGLRWGTAQAEQMRPLWQIAGAEPSALIALCAIATWQLAIGLAEELYYRGLVQGGGVLALGALLPGGGEDASLLRGCVVEGLPLLLASALFGLVHSEFVRGDEGEASGGDGLDTPPLESKELWFRVTAAYGLLYGLLYVGSGHRVLAPLCAHAGINIGLCVRDWRLMRASTAEALERIFPAD